MPLALFQNIGRTRGPCEARALGIPLGMGRASHLARRARLTYLLVPIFLDIP